MTQMPKAQQQVILASKNTSATNNNNPHKLQHLTNVAEEKLGDDEQVVTEMENI